MPQPNLAVLRLIWRTGAFVLAVWLASAVVAGNGVLWRLRGHVPVMCAILAVDTPASRPAAIVTIITSCNAERYQLVLRHRIGQTRLRAAQSSAGLVQISGGAVTITSSQPGYALTTVELTSPVSPEGLSVTLQSI